MATIDDPIAADIVITRIKPFSGNLVSTIRQAREFLAHLASVDPATLEADGTFVILGTRMPVADLLQWQTLAQQILGMASANNEANSKLVTKYAGQR